MKHRKFSFFALFVMVLLFAGCAPNQSATQQLAQQTTDPAIIALAVWTDAQDAYIAAAQLYKPYQAVVKKIKPETDKKIIGWLSEANKILNDWEKAGSGFPEMGKQTFREYIRKVTLEIALNFAEVK